MRSEKKKAILVVSFGTSHEETREKTLDAIERRIAEEFPDWDVRKAYTSKMIIRILRKRDNLKVDYITEALQRLVDEGFKKVVVIPTHIISGYEFEDVRMISDGFRNRFDTLKIGGAMFSSVNDYEAVINAIEEMYMKRFFGDDPKGKAMVLMGHGSDHIANACYSELQMRMRRKGIADVYVTTVEGFPSVDYTIEKIQEGDYNKICLVPFLIVAGDHAKNDMAGYDDNSLKTRFTMLGYEVECILEGLGEHKPFQDIFLDHLRDMVND